MPVCVTIVSHRSKGQRIDMDKDLIREYPSNTVISTCNNYILLNEKEITIKGRIFYKMRESGCFPYRFFFNNAVDSTFDNGSVAYANLIGTDLTVVEAAVGIWNGKVDDYDGSNSKPLTFYGKKGYVAKAGEFYYSDEIMLDVPKDSYLVFQWTVKGKDIPFTPDKVIPSHIWDEEKGKWVPSPNMPQPYLIGAKRAVSKRVCFFGDSITQGLGTSFDTYLFWVADIARAIPKDIAVWDIGLGFGRAQDAASDGYWLAKAKTADFVNLCFGVNDIMQGRTAEEIKNDLTTIVKKLKEAGVPVGVFTIPPFDYDEKMRKIWYECDDYIKNVLAKECAYCFNTALYWGLEAPEDYKSRWGGHPNEEGCQFLADGFVKNIKL